MNSPHPDFSEINPHLALWQEETFVSTRERAWENWTTRAESLIGHDLDGDEDRDGYSLDDALVCFDDGMTPEAYAAKVAAAKRALPKVFIVAVYLIDRAYGGPEEGGWYFDCGELVRQVRIFKNSKLAYDFTVRLNKKLQLLNRDRRPLSSVASDGLYQAQTCHDVAPAHYPKERPHYE